MESELQKFRRRKQLEDKKAELKSKLKTTANSWLSSFYSALLPGVDDEEEDLNTVGGNNKSSKKFKNDGETITDNNKTVVNNVKNNWLLYLVIFLRWTAWLLVYIGFIKIGFGAVFFTISLLIFIYMNTRKRKQKGETSAYSVFNKDCQSIDGTLKAEHLEKQLLYRS